MNPPRREEIFNLPNLLTLLRVGSIPLLVALAYLPGQFWAWLAGGLFFVAGLTDLLDGWLARRMKKITLLGQYLDPVADKLLISSMLVMLTHLGRVPAWMTILIICREIAVTGMRAVAANHNFTVPSDLWGKFKTALQMLGVFLLLLNYPMGGFDPGLWGLVAMYMAVAVTAWSGFLYGRRFQRLLADGAGRDLPL
jgi:CDP-diacylglycerol--glycerol-3-phosphate 3-phosphatidyltransferase